MDTRRMKSVRKRHLFRLAAATAVVASSLISSSVSFGAGDLVKNGLFTEGENGKPAAWTPEAYVTDAGATTYEWKVDAQGVGVATVRNHRPNDARYVQNVPVSPSSWYRISGWVRVENVPTEALGGYLSVLDTFHNSTDLRGTQDWQSVELWVKTGALETSLKVACRLGGYGAMNTGAAHCTGISVEAAGRPPRSGGKVFGGNPEEKDSAIPLQQIVTTGVLLIGGLALWWYLRPAKPR